MSFMQTMKATATAHPNLAFVKYMGRKDEVLRLPENASVSVNLSNLSTTTTVEFSPEHPSDLVVLNGELEEGEQSRVVKHLDRIRALAKIPLRAKVVSNNSFPIGTGLSSSSSGFAALTVAGAAAAGLRLSEKELSILARQGSGSACRSIPDGFVLWRDGDTSETSYAESLYPPDYWDIADVVAIVHRERKDVSSSASHVQVTSGPYYRARIARMPAKIERCLELLKRKDFPAFGEFLEEEARDLHVIFMSAGIIHLEPGTLDIMKRTATWRKEGIPVYYTINTGQDIHLLCERKNVEAVKTALGKLGFVREIIVNVPAEGARLTEQHLF
jgi:diphosphomevalonate decarboxylase